MTIKEFEKAISFAGGCDDELTDYILDNTEVWSGSACTGYCLKAMFSAGANTTFAQQVETELKNLYSTMNTTAASQYCKERRQS